jgi:outer membrane protein
MMKRLGMTFAWLLVSSTAWSATDLVNAWQAAREHDPGHQAEAAAARAGGQKRAQARALWMPTLSLQAGGGVTDTKSDVNGASFYAPQMGYMSNAQFVTQIHQGTDTRVSVTASLPLYGPQRHATAAQLERQSDLADLDLQQADLALFLKVAGRYFDVLVAEDALASLRANKRAVQESLAIAQENFRVGKNASTDVHEARARFDAVDAEESQLVGDLENKRALFEDLTGLPATGLAHLRDDASLDGLRVGDLQGLIGRALAHNPAIQASDTVHEIARQEAEKNRVGRAATVDLVAQLGEQRVAGNNGAGSIYSSTHSEWVGLVLNLPLYTGGMRGARLGESLALAEKARFEADAARLAVSEQVRAAYIAINTGLQRIGAFEQGQISAASQLDATKTGHELGARTTADVLNAQKSFFQVRSDLLRTRYEVLLASLSLAAATGELDVGRFEAVDAYFAK